MTHLVALLSSGKGTWGQVNSLIKLGKWEKIHLICNDFAYETFDPKTPKAVKIKYDEKNTPIEEFKKLSEYFKKNVNDFEVALNLTSGTGAEHMAIISAILKAGLGVRFIYADFDEIKEFELLNEKYVPEEYDNNEI